MRDALVHALCVALGAVGFVAFLGCAPAMTPTETCAVIPRLAAATMQQRRECAGAATSDCYRIALPANGAVGCVAARIGVCEASYLEARAALVRGCREREGQP